MASISITYMKRLLSLGAKRIDEIKTFAAITLCVVLGGLVGLLVVTVEVTLDAMPQSDLGNGCTGSIVWQPVDKYFDPICGVEVNVRRINKNFVYVKTYQ